MPEDDKTRTGAKTGCAEHQSEYLYHDQGEKGRFTPPPKRRPHKQKKRPENAVEEALVGNVRKFSIVAVVLFLVLLFAVYVTKRNWAQKQARFRRPGPEQLTMSDLNEDIGAKELAARSQPVLRRQGEEEVSMPGSYHRANFLATRARALVKQEKHAEAIERYVEALATWPELTELWKELALAYARQGEVQDAQHAYEEAIAVEPANAELMNQLGLIHIYQKQYPSAVKVLEQAKAVRPEFVQVQINLALCHIAMADRDAARSQLEQTLSIEPANARALKELAYVEASSGQYEKALAHLENAIRTAPDSAALHFDAAATCALLGRQPEALAYLASGEACSSPASVYRVFTQPAFREIRMTEQGQLFQKGVAARARTFLPTDNASQQDGVKQPVSVTVWP